MYVVVEMRLNCSGVLSQMKSSGVVSESEDDTESSGYGGVVVVVELSDNSSLGSTRLESIVMIWSMYSSWSSTSHPCLNLGLLKVIVLTCDLIFSRAV